MNVGWIPQKFRPPTYRAIRDPLLIIDADPLWEKEGRRRGEREREREQCVEINRGKVLFVPHKSARGHIFFELVIK